MSNRPCVPETLMLSKYCRLLICQDCGLVHFNLPYHVSLQFEVYRFLGIADAFTQAAKKLRARSKTSSKGKAKVIEFKRSH